MEDINTAEQCGQMCQIGIGALAVSGTVFTGYIVNKIKQCMKTKEAPAAEPVVDYESMSTVSLEQMRNALSEDIYSEDAAYHLPEWIIESSLRKLNRTPLLKGVVNYLAYHHSSDNTPSSHRFILKGVPGTGKTTLALSIAKKLDYRVVFRSATSLMGKYLNESTVNLRELLEDVSQSETKTMLIIDELDALFKNRESHHNDHNANYRAFEAALDDLLRERNENVVVVGTTNDYDSLPESMQSRFGNNHFEIEPPNLSERTKIIRELFNNIVVSDGTLDEAYILDLSNRMKPSFWSSTYYTDRDIHNLIDSARMLVYCEKDTINQELDAIDLRSVKIGKKEIDQVFKQYPKSGKRLSRKELFEYAQATAHTIIIASYAIEGLKLTFQAGKWVIQNKEAIVKAAQTVSACSVQ